MTELKDFSLCPNAVVPNCCQQDESYNSVNDQIGEGKYQTRQCTQIGDTFDSLEMSHFKPCSYLTQ